MHMLPNGRIRHRYVANIEPASTSFGLTVSPYRTVDTAPRMRYALSIEEFGNMPEVSRFYGIIIKLFFEDHLPPHFHAVYGEHIGVFNIDSLEMIEGDLPNRSRRLVIEWATLYQSRLQAMWQNQKFQKLPPLE